MDINLYDKFIATVCIRRGDGWAIRPSMKPFDGKPVTVMASWIAEDTSIYAGEWCMQVLSEGFPIPWIACGDLTDLLPTDD